MPTRTQRPSDAHDPIFFSRREFCLFGGLLLLSGCTGPAIRSQSPEDGGLGGGESQVELIGNVASPFGLHYMTVEGPALVGYAAWPRLQVEAAGKTHAVAGLAPLAVTPPRHRAGIGTALVQAGLADLRARGETLVFVLGDPVYYRRFGFSLETAHSFESPYAGEHFMALALTADAPKSGRVRYPPPFDALG